MGGMRLDSIGEIVRDEWIMTGWLRNQVELDEFIVMPNHFHGIFMINAVGTTRRVAPCET
jgi:REP element-mobilizing transposase RayT